MDRELPGSGPRLAGHRKLRDKAIDAGSPTKALTSPDAPCAKSAESARHREIFPPAAFKAWPAGVSGSILELTLAREKRDKNDSCIPRSWLLSSLSGSRREG